VSDARGGVFYHVRIRGRGIVGGFELLPAEMLAARLETGLPVFSSGPIAAVPQARTAFPDAVIIAALAADEEPAADTLEPLYLKPAHITKPRAR